MGGGEQKIPKISRKIRRPTHSGSVIDPLYIINIINNGGFIGRQHYIIDGGEERQNFTSGNFLRRRLHTIFFYLFGSEPVFSFFFLKAGEALKNSVNRNFSILHSKQPALLLPGNGCRKRKTARHSPLHVGHVSSLHG